MAPIARKFAAQGANPTILCVDGQAVHRVSHHRLCEVNSYASCSGTSCYHRLHEEGTDDVVSFVISPRLATVGTISATTPEVLLGLIS